MNITLTFDSLANNPTVVTMLAAWAGMFAHILKKNLGGVGTYKQLKKYCKLHFTTILLSGLIAFGLGAHTLSGYDPAMDTLWDLMALAFGKAFIGDNIIDIQRKIEEQKR